MYKTAGLVLAGILYYSPLYAQYVDLPGNSQAIQEYVDEAPENANTSIMYIFYDNWGCEGCAEAIRLIYYLYQKYYINDFNVFEINYMADADYNYRLDYDLTQPLSVVLVRMRNGQALGYYKIDNPQRLLYNDFDFEENILSQINNFLAM
ncbi:MAG: hypothetical protein IJS88_04745 [Alphaproteobacteria bacterium]|nr:hypothetical protein [Alphaproteobacteria bacterium]